MNGTAPKTLSINATEYYVGTILDHYRAVLSDPDHWQAVSLPPHLTEAIHKRLALLQPIANEQLRPLVDDVASLVNQAQYAAAGEGSPEALRNRVRSVQSRLSDISMDQDLMEKLVREGF